MKISRTIIIVILLTQWTGSNILPINQAVGYTPEGDPHVLMWFRADTGVLTAPDSNDILTWQDQSANRFDAIAVEAPPFTGFPQRGTRNIPNGKTVETIQFNNNSCLQIMPTPGIVNVPALTVFLVAGKKQNETGSNVAYSHQSWTGGKGFTIDYGGAGGDAWSWNAGVRSLLSQPDIIPDNTLQLIVGVFDPNALAINSATIIELRIDQELKGGLSRPFEPVLYSTNTNEAQTSIGGLPQAVDGAPFYGEIAEIIVFDEAIGDLTDPVSGYLYDKYIASDCGETLTTLLNPDINKDCTVNFKDFTFLTNSWFDCTDPEKTECDQYYLAWNTSASPVPPPPPISPPPVDLVRYNPRIPFINVLNMLPNSSFELGPDGWGTLGTITGWGGDISGLYGTVQVGGAWHGDQCLKIEMGPGITPVTHFDSPDLVRKEQHAPLAANLGWMEASVGQDYTLSAYMRADIPGVQAKLLFAYGSVASNSVTKQWKTVTLSTEWQRYSFTQPAGQWDMYVAVGPDMTSNPELMVNVWIDAVQVEAVSSASIYSPHEPVEVGIHTGQYGNLYEPNDPFEINLFGSNTTLAPTSVVLNMTMTDYFDTTILNTSVTLDIPAQGSEKVCWPIPVTNKGFYRMTISWQANGRSHSKDIKLAVIEPYLWDQSPFGINHSPTSVNMRESLRRAGITWARDWSLRWDTLEPVEGQLSFDKSDEQIGQLQASGLNVMSLLPPSPSSEWASPAPAWVGDIHLRARTSYMPSDPSKLYGFIDQAVNQYKATVKFWEFLNEPLYTIFALPNASVSTTWGLPDASYTVSDYLTLLQSSYTTMKAADPACQVIAGFGAEPTNFAAEFIQAGGLYSLDIYNVHRYGGPDTGSGPGRTPPEEFITPMVGLLAIMDASPSGRKPIWITEHAYFASDDKPWTPWTPIPGAWAQNRLLDSERQGADWSVRFAASQMANGAEKIFYHQGTEGEVNKGNWNVEQNMLAEEGVPKKFYAALSALANRLGANPVFASEMVFPATIGGQPTTYHYGYTFDCDSGTRAVAIAWATEQATIAPATLNLQEGVIVYDTMGNEISTVVFSTSPIYLETTSMSASALATNWLN